MYLILRHTPPTQLATPIEYSTSTHTYAYLLLMIQATLVAGCWMLTFGVGRASTDACMVG
jgi:hypothetical protein